MRKHLNAHLIVLLPAALLAAACSQDSPTAASSIARPEAVANAVKFWEAGATVAWNERAEALAAARVVNASQVFLYLSMAQFRAAEAAQAAPGPHPPISAAIAGASAAILASYFPLDVAVIEATLDAQREADPWPGAKHADFAAGEAIGRAVATRVLTFAQGDLVGLTDPLLPPTGPRPTGPGNWVYNGGPLVRGNLGARPLFMTSASQLRPPPPPAFGSAAFATALDEVRQISLTRTAEQIAIANYWNVNQSGRSLAALMGIGRELIVSHRRRDAEAARIMFIASAALYEGNIACFEAKYTYWYIRPAQADPTIATLFPTPAHPSYPSAHSCGSGALTAVFAAFFPSEAANLQDIALESSLSRLYAGIHYRFDMEAGLAVGRAAAALAVDADLSTVAPLP
jgi:membrane-associated phospholipid phosphatase